MENASAATDSKPEKGGLKSRMVSLGYRFQEGKSNSGFLDFSNNKVHVQHLNKKEMETDESFFENARFIESLRHCSFLGNRFIDPINESELYLVSDTFDCTLTERIEQLKKDKGILFYMFFELPCLHEKGGIKYTEIPPIYRNMVKMLIDGLFFLHEEKGKCTNGFTVEDLVIVRDVVCLNIINFVAVSDENRARDMHCLKMILDGWFPDRVETTEKVIHSSGELLKKNLHDSPHTQLGEFGYLPKEILLSPASMSHLRKQLGRFYYLLRKYKHHRQSLKSFFSNHIATMDPSKRLQFIKNCGDKSNSRKFHSTQYKNALINIGDMNGWVGKVNVSQGPLLSVLTNPIVLSREENIKATMRYTTSGHLDTHYGPGPRNGNFLVNKSLVSFWRNSGTHLQDHMPDHLAAKRTRIEEIKMMLLEKERKRLRLKALWKEPKKPNPSSKEKEKKENDLKIFDDVDIELTIMSVYDDQITLLFEKLFEENILDAFLA